MKFSHIIATVACCFVCVRSQGIQSQHVFFHINDIDCKAAKDSEFDDNFICDLWRSTMMRYDFNYVKCNPMQLRNKTIWYTCSPSILICEDTPMHIEFIFPNDITDKLTIYIDYHGMTDLHYTMMLVFYTCMILIVIACIMLSQDDCFDNITVALLLNACIQDNDDAVMIKYN